MHWSYFVDGFVIRALLLLQLAPAVKSTSFFSYCKTDFREAQVNIVVMNAIYVTLVLAVGVKLRRRCCGV